MNMGNDVVKRGESFPVPPKRRRGGTAAIKREKQRMGIEAAAIAYVQMENNEYRYPEGARRQWSDEGDPVPNGRECMRRAGYAPGSLDHFEEYLGSQDEFWELVELHRLRRTDPMFRKEQENQLWQEIGGEALRNLYERIFYYPHSLSTEQHIKLVKLILDAGITLKKMGGDGASKSDALLLTIEDSDKRMKILDGFEDSLREELKEVEAIKKAHKAMDREDE